MFPFKDFGVYKAMNMFDRTTLSQHVLEFILYIKNADRMN